MFEAVLSDATMFKRCIDAISTLIDEGEFIANEEGLMLRAMDPSQIAMVDFKLPKSTFEKFSSNTNKIGLNIDDLSILMGRVRAGEKLEMKLDEEKARLVLIFKGHSTRKFSIPLLDLGGGIPNEPKLEFESVVKLNGAFFKEALKDTQLVSSHVVLHAKPDVFVIKAQGDKGDVEIETKKDSKQIIEYKVESESRAMFPLDYLNDLLKSVDSSTNVTLSLSTNKPLKMDYKIGEAKITYYLAPRIEEE